MHGINWELETKADEMLAKDRKDRGITKTTEMKDILNSHQLKRRKMREIITSSGTPDESLMRGMASRAYAAPREDGPRDLRSEMSPLPILTYSMEPQSAPQRRSSQAPTNTTKNVSTQATGQVSGRDEGVRRGRPQVRSANAPDIRGKRG